ncbi:ABC-2 type transport system permease protein [Georgenia satyanarayanai]|uniref:ABC-2 type transport system permease protein n=1 Tax=Georgenia satyanarayanai TaxID=860221 RepID=A0A2Y9AUN1_9MICO|nr:ABC transporter permease [Georgenia satyanarayanai]PYF96336.1 ABC-2 type transport system permease protein [Georgenia satyanarayanai]SSA47058.1 ABC-2 type transport system permease protein [Georgenia satyanarayanai]
MTATALHLPTGPSAGRTARLLGYHSLVQLRSSLRSAEFAVGAVAVPVILYAMFGLPDAGSLLPGGTRVGLAMLVSFGCYGVVSLAIFTFGEDVAKERGRGWPRTLAATPFPTWVHLAGKAASAVVHALAIVVAMSVAAATLGGVRLEATEWLALGAALVSGVLLFSTLGFAIAYLARPRAATVIANLVFLPLSFASGFFFPLSELPDVVGRVAQWLPTYHFGQLAYRTVMPAEDVEFWTGRALQPVWVHLVAVVGTAALLGVVTVWAARREAVTRRG